VVLDTDNRIEWANPRALLQLGLNLKSDRRQPIVNFLREPEFIRYLERGDYSEAVLVDSHRNTGATLSLQLVPFAADEKLLMSRDVTHLEAVGRMRRDFIANVSHELKTPLTVITGFLETLQELELDAKQRTRFLQLMQEQAKSMQRLVEDLLTLSALESEQSVPAENSFAIVPLLLRLSADAKGLSQGQHTVALEIGDAATVLGSRDELECVRQPGIERDSLYTRRWHDHVIVARRSRRRRRVCGRRHRYRNCARTHSALTRALLSRRSQPFACNRRNGSRTRDRQARPAAASGGTRNRQHPGQGQHLRCAPAGPTRGTHAVER